MRTLLPLSSLIVCLWLPPSTAAEAFRLTDHAGSRDSWLTTVNVTGKGTFEFEASEAEAKPLSHPVTVQATYRWSERRLPSAGRDEAAFRAIRIYRDAKSEIRVGDQVTSPSLRSARSRVVTQATREGILAYSLDGPLTPAEVELLPSPGDPLLLAALLPKRDVEVGESWTPADWIAPAMAGAEVSFNNKLTCRLDSVKDDQATISFEGTVDGATKGTTTNTSLSGTLTYSLKTSAIIAADVTHTEKRPVGPLSPGMTLTLTSAVRRTQATADAAIGDADAATVPLVAPSESMLIEHQVPFGVSLASGREWQVFHQTSKLLILRLLDRGGIVAQCNVVPAPTVRPGSRTPEQQFQEDIRRSLGERLSEIISAEELQVQGVNKIYRVTAAGKARETEHIWRYYLVTAPDGRQAGLVFTAEPEVLNRLADRDLELVTSLTFLSR